VESRIVRSVSMGHITMHIGRMTKENFTKGISVSTLVQLRNTKSKPSDMNYASSDTAIDPSNSMEDV
jgi:hypothetical protein